MRDTRKFYRVKYGFNVSDQVTITELELEKAIYMKGAGKTSILGGELLDGARIINIRPDFHRYTGWNREYEPKSAQDYKEIKESCPDLEGVLEYYNGRVKWLIDNKKEKLIGTNAPILELEAGAPRLN